MTETITGQTGTGFVRKADRLFRNDDDGVWTEILQNARRAGATKVEISIEEGQNGGGVSTVTVRDNGHGIEKFQDLLTLGESGWESETEHREDPAGMGFFALCRSEVQVQSGNRAVTITPAVFLGRDEATVEQVAHAVDGTRIRFTRDSTREQLVAALKRTTEFYPLEVRLGGLPLPSRDFLEGALHREWIDGIEVGFATSFAWGCRFYPDSNWNFYGARIRGPELSFTGLLVPGQIAPLAVYARFNVLDTARVKLQLPDRKGIIEDQFLNEFLEKARGAAYRLFAKQERHALPFHSWKEAQELGVTLPEAVCLLTRWHALPGDENAEPLFGKCDLRLVPDASKVVLVARDLEYQHTLEGAFECGAHIEGELYFEDLKFSGYRWYNTRPRLVDARILRDGIPYDAKKPLSGRPKKIEIAATIAQMGSPDRELRLDAFVHVDGDSDIWNGTCFVAVENSPWDNQDLEGPFSIHDFIISATFRPSDDYSEADSWQTQSDRYEEEVRREINAYFRGPRATLLSILHQALDHQACQLAEELGVREIRFNRETNSKRWLVDLVDEVEAIHGSPVS